jgi:dephospho-CoA kinase
MLPIKIALTGGIACGKSSIAHGFAKLGVDIINLDELSRVVVNPNSKGLDELIDCFGECILNTDKTLNRQTLRDILLKNPANQIKIESILHPKILAKMQIEINKVKNKLVIIEVPLLVEKNLAYLFDRAIIVKCDKQAQLTRLIERENIDENQAKSMVLSQTNHKNRIKLAKQLPIDIVDNNSDFVKTTQKINQLYQKLINL